MQILFLDLAHHDGSVAAVTETETLVRRAVDHRLRDDGLVPLMEQVVKEAGWKAEDLTSIACIIGPGGFTSLRVAVAATNALAWELKIPILPIHGSELWRARAGDVDGLWFHSTRADQLFVRGLGALTTLWPEPTLQTSAEILAKAPTSAAWAGELIPAHAEALSSLNLRPLSLHSVEKVLPQIVKNAQPTPAPVDPWYGRGY